MYIPPAFVETEQVRLFDLIEQHSFGLLVSQHNGEPVVSHLPFLLDRTAAPHGRLIGHMARANSQWRHADGGPVLVVFSGPHAYISPSWIGENNIVPTWNYVAVHAMGELRATHDRPRLLEIVEQTVERYESSQSSPWSFDASTDFAGKLAELIVGFEIDLTRIEGKWKLSQNHSDQRQAAVVTGLQQTGSPGPLAVADLMQANLNRPGESD